MIIQGILIPFDGEDNDLLELEKRIEELTGYGTERVSMTKETHGLIVEVDE